MIKRDYILREIERLIQLMQSMVGLIDLRQYPEALKIINDTARDMFGLDADTLNRLPLEYLRRHVGELEQTALLAALFEAEGVVLSNLGNLDAALYRWIRALTLLLDVDEEGRLQELSGLPTSVEQLNDRLSAYELPADLNARLFRYFTRQGEFATAENYLWSWRSTDADLTTAQHEGTDFYQHLLSLSDRVIEAGGLSREEVEESLVDFGES